MDPKARPVKILYQTTDAVQSGICKNVRGFDAKKSVENVEDGSGTRNKTSYKQVSRLRKRTGLQDPLLQDRIKMANECCKILNQ